MDQIKIGIIGAGGIAYRRSIPGMMLSDRIMVPAIMDSNREACRKVQGQYNIAASYESYEALLAADNVDAVYIASPVFCHYEQVIAAANAKKHILCEKPFGLHAAQAEAMLLYCREKNVLLDAGFVMRFNHLHRKMRDIVRSGALGDIVNIYVNFSCWYPENNSWRQKKELSGGGVLIDMAVHSLDLIEFITGKQIESISAFIRTRHFHYEVDDSASLLMELSEGGTCSVNSYFCIPDEAAESRMEIYGTKGVLKANGTLSQQQSGSLSGILISENGTSLLEEKADISENIYKLQFEGFCDRMTGLQTDNADAYQMLHIQKIVDAAYQSSQTRAAVTLLDDNSGERLPQPGSDSSP